MMWWQQILADMLGPAGLVAITVTTIATIVTAKARADKSEGERTPPNPVGTATAPAAVAPRLTVDEWQEIRTEVARQVRDEVLAELQPEIKAGKQAMERLAVVEASRQSGLMYAMELRDRIHRQADPPPPAWPADFYPGIN